MSHHSKNVEKISFDPSTDYMIVMGDIFDWNDEGISLLEFMSDYLVGGSMQLIRVIMNCLPRCT